MAGHAYAIANGKGGVGKTTVAINLWAALRSAGLTAAIVDADLRVPDVGRMLGLEADATLHDVLATRAIVEEVMIEYEDGAGVIPGDPAVGAIGQADIGRLEYVIESLRDRYDVVLVDTAAGLAPDDVVPLGLVDGVIVVTTPDEPAREAAAKTLAVVDGVDGHDMGLIVNRVQADDDPPAVAAALDTSLRGAVPESSRLADPMAAGGPLVWDAADTQAADAFDAIATWLAGTVETDTSTAENTRDDPTPDDAAAHGNATLASPPPAEPERSDRFQGAGGLRGWLANLFN